jgi:hypothetical protein
MKLQVKVKLLQVGVNPWIVRVWMLWIHSSYLFWMHFQFIVSQCEFQSHFMWFHKRKEENKKDYEPISNYNPVCVKLCVNPHPSCSLNSLSYFRLCESKSISSCMSVHVNSCQSYQSMSVHVNLSWFVSIHVSWSWLVSSNMLVDVDVSPCQLMLVHICSCQPMSVYVNPC